MAKKKLVEVEFIEVMAGPFEVYSLEKVYKLEKIKADRFIKAGICKLAKKEN